MEIRPGPVSRQAAASADAQRADDPLRATAADGWSPDHISPVRSRYEGGFAGSAVNFTLGGVTEQPGQRLSQAQVEQLAPYFATQFGLDETYVRRELANVYLYVGGPSSGGSAMAIGHHVYVPDAAALKRIMSPAGKRWLTHELAHTMQFLAYQNASPHRFLAEYFSSMIVGRDPQVPGQGTGPAVWGALFTGLRGSGRTQDELGGGALTVRDRLVSSIVPGTVVGLPVALAAGGALAASRATTGVRLLGTGNAMTTALGAVAAPAVVGSAIGTLHEQIGVRGAATMGGIAGGLLAGTALWRGGAFATQRVASSGSTHVLGAIGRTLGSGGTIAAAVGATVAGIAIGALAAGASATTLRGGARSADLVAELRHRTGDGCATCRALQPLSFGDALHDAHWVELDAEALAQQFVRGQWDRPDAGDGPVQGRVPTPPTRLQDRIDAQLSDRIDWGVKLPLIVGIPAAIGVGSGVLAARTGMTALRSTVRDGRGPAAVAREALRMLGDKGRGISNSMGVGAAVTLAPLVAGGVVGPLVHDATGSTTAARLGGAGAGAVAAGALLTLLQRGSGSGLIVAGGKVAAGMAVAGVLGLIAGGVATDALLPHARTYDVSASARAGG